MDNNISDIGGNRGSLEWAQPLLGLSPLEKYKKYIDTSTLKKLHETKHILKLNKFLYSFTIVPLNKYYVEIKNSAY